MSSATTSTRPSPAEVSPLFSLPAELFAAVLRRLPVKDLRNLPSTCKSLADNPHVLYALYHEPFRVDDCIEHHHVGAEDESAPHRNADCGKIKFRKLVTAIASRPDRGQYVRKLAMSHFSTLKEFRFLEQHCPNLRSLDLSHVGDEFFGPGWTWQELVGSCPMLFERLQTLKVSGDMYSRRGTVKIVSHSNLKRRIADPNRNALTMLLRACPNLETLAIAGTKGFSWAHTNCQRELSDAIVKGAGHRLRTIQLWDMATCIRSFRLFLEPLTDLPKLQTIAINFNQTLEFFTGGDGGEVEDYAKQRYDRTHKGGEADVLYASTTKDLRAYLSELKEIADEGRWEIRPLDDADTAVRHNPRNLYTLINDEHGLGLLQFMKSQLRWTHPVLAWDFLWRPSLPFGASRSLAGMAPDDRIGELKTLAKLMETLRGLDLPVRIELSALHSRECVFFDSGAGSTEDWFFASNHSSDEAHHPDHHNPAIATITTVPENPIPNPTTIRTDNSPFPALGTLVDSLSITYGSEPPVLERPGRAGYGTKTHWHGQLPRPEMALLAEDVMRFRPFWRSFNSTFPGLRELKVCVPPYVSRSWSGWDLTGLCPGAEDGEAWREVSMEGEHGEGKRVVMSHLRG